MKKHFRQSDEGNTLSLKKEQTNEKQVSQKRDKERDEINNGGEK
jgi:hypothetical protein